MSPHDFEHAMCGGCWIRLRSARLPYTMCFEEIEQCCWCGRPTSSGIYHWSVWAPECKENPGHA